MKPNDAQWYSHKVKGPLLRYEIAPGNFRGYIVWMHSPLSFRSLPDLNLFTLRVKHLLKLSEEMVIGDKGYREDACLVGSEVSGERRKIVRVIRAR